MILLVNAMNASAAIFDALSEVDSKFAKIADKEYESVSTDVKKWFKKLNVSFGCYRIGSCCSWLYFVTERREKS
jgi:hypothetical protein